MTRNRPSPIFLTRGRCDEAKREEAFELATTTMNLLGTDVSSRSRMDSIRDYRARCLKSRLAQYRIKSKLSWRFVSEYETADSLPQLLNGNVENKTNGPSFKLVLDAKSEIEMNNFANPELA